MRDQNEYAAFCMSLLDDIGIPYGHITSFKVNTRAAKRWGQCKRVPGGFEININVALLDERNNEDGLINTILHELLHSCEGCMNHGEKWKRYANRVYSAYGIHIKRCSSSDEKGVLEETRPLCVREPAYAVKCAKCGSIIRRTRKSKVIQHPEMFRCGKCYGSLYAVANY